MIGKLILKNYLKDIKFSRFNNLDLNTFKSLIIHRKLNKVCKKIIKHDDPGQPNFYFERKKKLTIKDYLNKIIKIFKYPNLLIFFLKNKFLHYLSKFIIFETIYNLYHGSKINYITKLNSKKEIFVNIHSSDYSRLISYNIKKKSKKPIVIFLMAQARTLQMISIFLMKNFL